MKLLKIYFGQKSTIQVRVLFQALLLALFLLVGVQEAMMAQEANTGLSYDNKISFTPLTPTTNDVIQITPSGIWNNSCVPKEV